MKQCADKSHTISNTQSKITYTHHDYMPASTIDLKKKSGLRLPDGHLVRIPHDPCGMEHYKLYGVILMLTHNLNNIAAR